MCGVALNAYNPHISELIKNLNDFIDAFSETYVLDYDTLKELGEHEVREEICRYLYRMRAMQEDFEWRYYRGKSDNEISLCKEGEPYFKIDGSRIINWNENRGVIKLFFTQVLDNNNYGKNNYSIEHDIVLVLTGVVEYSLKNFSETVNYITFYQLLKQESGELKLFFITENYNGKEHIYEDNYVIFKEWCITGEHIN